MPKIKNRVTETNRRLLGAVGRYERYLGELENEKVKEEKREIKKERKGRKTGKRTTKLAKLV